MMIPDSTVHLGMYTVFCGRYCSSFQDKALINETWGSSKIPSIDMKINKEKSVRYSDA